MASKFTTFVEVNQASLNISLLLIFVYDKIKSYKNDKYQYNDFLSVPWMVVGFPPIYLEWD